jgi:hypothetical protein
VSIAGLAIYSLLIFGVVYDFFRNPLLNNPTNTADTVVSNYLEVSNPKVLTAGKNLITVQVFRDKWRGHTCYLFFDEQVKKPYSINCLPDVSQLQITVDKTPKQKIVSKPKTYISEEEQAELFKLMQEEEKRWLDEEKAQE